MCTRRRFKDVGRSVDISPDSTLPLAGVVTHGGVFDRLEVVAGTNGGK